ncbi:MAG TPA: hypothetical protein VFF20_08320 [Pseudogracilibacillus sp.]|nr:hypothetical protein [Pseudogracilibacillus sp.]
MVGISVLGGCAAIDSLTKDVESDTKGLERTVTVYSKTGDVLAEYQGVIRTKSSNSTNAVIFEINGKRVNVYNADVVIEEKGAK